MEIHELNTFSGTLGESDFFATDNGTDTSKVSAEEMFSPLNARIDNIIAGDAPSAQEVIDARLGAGGVVYPSLGDAIREQITDLTNVRKNITSIYNFERGTWSSASQPFGKLDSDTQARNIDMFFVAANQTIQLADTNYEFNMLTVNPTTGERTGTTNWVTEYTLLNPRFCFLAYRKKTNDESAESLVSNVSNIFTASSIKIMTENVALKYHFENINNQFTGLKNIRGIITSVDNFEVGRWGSDAQPFSKVDSNYEARNIDMFFVDAGQTIAVADSDYEFNMATIDVATGERTATTDWVTEYTLLNPRFCFLAYRKKTADEPAGVLVSNVSNIFTADSVKIMTENVALKYHLESVSQTNNASVLVEANIVDIPSAISKPVISYIKNLQNGNACQAKGAIFKNGNNYCVTFGENLDGNTDDFPRVSTTGTLAMKYRAFSITDGEEVNVVTGTLAQKGSSYRAWDGTTKTFPGGCGLPSGANGYQFFCGAFTGTKTYNGYANYGMMPCCVSVNVPSNGGTPVFGTIRELSLSVDGVKGAFDVARIDSNFVDYQIYYTTNPPCYDSSDEEWYWIIPVIKGFIICKSENVVDWEYVSTVKTSYQPFAEIACGVLDSGNLIFASRNDQDGIAVGIVPKQGGLITMQYLVLSVSARVYLAKAGSEFLMIFNETNKNEGVCIRISRVGNRLFFHRWYTIYHECTWYASVENQSIESGAGTEMYLVGGNGTLEENRGVSFAVLNLPDGFETIEDIETSIL